MARTVYTPRVSFTRPANATALTIKDVIGPAAGTAVMTFSPVVPYEKWSGIITGCLLIDPLVAATALVATLELYTAAPTTAADNAIFAPTDAQNLASFVASVPISSASRSDFSVNSAHTVGGLNIGFTTAVGSRALFGVLVARNAFTPGNAGVYGVELKVVSDH